MTDTAQEALDSLAHLVMCRCGPAYTERGLHDPDCRHYYAEGIATLRAALAAAPQPTTPGQRMIRAAEEAVAIARGEAEPASVYPAPEWEICEVCRGTGIAGHPDSGNTCCLCDGSGAVDPQPAVTDRQALVGAIRAARCEWANDGDSESCPDQAIADALLARGLRLPGNETMAWAVVGEDGGVRPDEIRASKKEAALIVLDGERIKRVAIRVVEGGDDE